MDLEFVHLHSITFAKTPTVDQTIREKEMDKKNLNFIYRDVHLNRRKKRNYSLKCRDCSIKDESVHHMKR